MTDEQTDVALFFGVDPPLVIPISQRAKDKMQLPEGVDCALFLDDAEKVLSLFGEDYVFEHYTEYEPVMILPCSVQRLH